ncbi:MAG: aminotransferase [Pseudomonadota bacterium]
MRPLSNSQMRDVETVLHPTTNLAAHRQNGPMVLERANGIHVWDTGGKRYIEGMAGLWCTALGYGNEELIETAREQMSRLSFTHMFGSKSHEPGIALAEKIKQIAPGKPSKVFFTSSGSEANDTQVKLAWYHANGTGRPDKKKIIARKGGYHGVTIASGSLTGLPLFHSDFDLPMARVFHTTKPHHYREGREGESEAEFSGRLAHDLETLIEREGADTIAAFIAEPVMGAGGVIVPPEGYFKKVQAILKRNDIRFIADEVICGFGRTGSMFGCDTFGIEPDSVSMAKAITSAYMPLGAVTVSDDVYDAMVEESRKLGMFAHGFTYTGHPVAAAVALKTIEIYERIDIVAHVRRVSPIFLTRLHALRAHPLVGETRGLGLLAGIELVSDKATKTPFEPKQGVGAQAVAFAQEAGLITRAVGGDTLALCPPLIIDGASINTMFDAMETALDQTYRWAAEEGLVRD